MGRDRSSDAVYRAVETFTAKGKSATAAGEQRQREGKGLHELVDPKGHGVIRMSISYLDPVKKGKRFVLVNGTALPIEDELDTTGSMGGNVAIAMKALPRKYNLLAKTPRAVLKRYDPQISTSIFGDVQDEYVLQRSQFEMDERIAEQMTLMFPERGGPDADEDPQYGLFGAAYLTKATIYELGLKGYHFLTTDARGRKQLSPSTLTRVFGPEVFDKVRENGHEVDEKQLPTTKEVVQDLLKTTHAFALIVGSGLGTISFWTEIYGKDRIIMLPETELLPEVQAAIIGLTEGTLTLQDLEQFLMEDAGLSKTHAASVKRAVAGIPIGAQAALPNFDKIPLKGAEFAAKGDLWPIGHENYTGKVVDTEPEEGSGRKKKKGKGTDWL